MKYLLDANVFMAANNLHYGLDFCPAFWDWLIMSNAQQKVFSIEKVGDEISAGDEAGIQDNLDAICAKVRAWTKRKKDLMKPRHIERAYSRLKQQGWVSA